MKITLERVRIVIWIDHMNTQLYYVIIYVNMFNNLKHTWKQISTLAKNVDCKL